MARFKIIEVFTHDSHLVVTAEHYFMSGALWFTEHYIWQGREGLKQRRATNALGQLLLDDGTVAPTQPGPRPTDSPEAFLPLGRTWARRPGPHMVDDSVLSTIRSIHRQRLASGWPATTARLPSCKPTPADERGCETLRLRFQNLLGYQE